MPLDAFLPLLRSLKAKITRKALLVLIKLPPAAVDPKTLALLNRLLNACESRYTIILAGLPPCLLPGAKDHIPPAKAREGRYRRIPACRICSIRSSCPGWDKDLACAPGSVRPIKDVPSEIVIEVTGQCNLSCACCTSESKRDHAVPFKTIRNIIHEAARLGIPNIRFTGGEPLLHPQLGEMLACAHERKLCVILNTNATLLTPALAKTIGSSVDTVLVSLQGYNESSDQRLTRSQHSFQHKIHNILLLRDHVPTVRAGTVITRILIENLPAYARLIRALGVSSWALFRPVTTAPNDLSSISPAEYRKLAIHLLRLRATGINVMLANAIPFCILPEPRVSASVMSGAGSDDGHSRLIWDPRGFFKPSYFIQEDLGQDIQTAWTHPFLKKLRGSSYLPRSCRNCDYFLWCQGGSRSAAHKTAGTYFAADPLFQKRPSKSLRIA